jgi:hypothetical protein
MDLLIGTFATTTNVAIEIKRILSASHSTAQYFMHAFSLKVESPITKHLRCRKNPLWEKAKKNMARLAKIVLIDRNFYKFFGCN